MHVHVHVRGARVDGPGSAVHVHVVRFSWMYAGQEGGERFELSIG